MLKVKPEAICTVGSFSKDFLRQLDNLFYSVLRQPVFESQRILSSKWQMNINSGLVVSKMKVIPKKTIQKITDNLKLKKQ